MRCSCFTNICPGQVWITYEALCLVMRGKQCVDWLLVQSLGHKVPAAVTCGQLKVGSRSLVSEGSWALLHFHTSRSTATTEGTEVTSETSKVKKVLPGFKVKIQSEASFSIGWSVV